MSIAENQPGAGKRLLVISLLVVFLTSFIASMSRMAATTEGYGMFAVVDYAAGTGNLNYIDKTRIGATGHSGGGNAAIRGAGYFGKQPINSSISSGFLMLIVACRMTTRFGIGKNYWV